MTQEYAQAAKEYLHKADSHFLDGDQDKASAKMWEAAAYAMKAVAAERGLPHADENEMRRTARKLSEEHNNSLIFSGFSIAEKFRHDSIYLFMEDEEWRLDRRKIYRLVDQVLALRVNGA